MKRKTTQDLIPTRHQPTQAGQYDIYPAFPIDDAKIGVGYEALATALAHHNRIVIDGYGGVFWDELQAELARELQWQGVAATWLDMRDTLLPEAEIDALVEPFLGGDDPVFGTRFNGRLQQFFDMAKVAKLQPGKETAVTILYGCGAALANWDDALLVYVDVPKNEIQFRARAASVINLGKSQPEHHKKMYKRFYFVDWVALNQHKAAILPEIDWFVDGQRPSTPIFISGNHLRDGLTRMSQSCFRVRPWFEPGAWGGHWIKQAIPQLPQNVPNYAWSFELIVPENGLLFQSGGALLEASFDLLMFHAHEAVLGNAAAQFGHEFPIRFDFLDTIDGGNLSLQCHPRPDFIKTHFGETFTQDETYYILDCKPDAQVYLGFRDGINPDEFRQALEQSAVAGSDVDVAQFVQIHPAKKHDLFLIPNGTIHCSGRNNMVLEISATPYIFTFKMYDWLRLDLDGKPRPLNIDRAFANLRFEMQGERVQRELLAQPALHSEGDGWRLMHLPTHPIHFYDVFRCELDAHSAVWLETNGSCQVMSLVEGETVLLETAVTQQPFNYAETFVVPAAAEWFRLVNQGETAIKIIIAFMKPDWTNP
ncbi:MAG: class I mannose-6-phosphate isomerase [Ardenticatenaceae bacterium]|nr:class I mannose-6-phosphate isomerase [Ardenticatenaceae bacterium]